jgi:hypothetical protein
MMFQWTESSILWSILSAMVTYRYTDSASSCTYLQLIGGDEGSGSKAVSPGATPLEAPALVSCTTKTCNHSPALSPSRGPASATSVPVVPYGVLPALDTIVPDTTAGR